MKIKKINVFVDHNNKVQKYIIFENEEKLKEELLKLIKESFKTEINNINYLISFYTENDSLLNKEMLEENISLLIENTLNIDFYNYIIYSNDIIKEKIHNNYIFDMLENYFIMYNDHNINYSLQYKKLHILLNNIEYDINNLILTLIRNTLINYYSIEK